MTHRPLSEGSRVRATGLPIEVDGVPGLSLNGRRHGADSLDRPYKVALTWEAAPPRSSPDELITVHGTWSGGRIAVDRAEPTGESRAVLVPPVMSLDPLPPRSQPVAADRLAAHRAATGPLTEAGLLANAHPTREGHPVGELCVYDVPAAREVLAAAGVPAEDFLIAGCRWSREDLTRARRLHEIVPEPLLAGFGAMTEGGQPVVLLDLKYLTPDVAEALNTLPSGLVRLEVYLQADE